VENPRTRRRCSRSRRGYGKKKKAIINPRGEGTISILRSKPYLLVVRFGGGKKKTDGQIDAGGGGRGRNLHPCPKKKNRSA